jgi:hypothetical protein
LVIAMDRLILLEVHRRDFIYFEEYLYCTKENFLTNNLAIVLCICIRLQSLQKNLTCRFQSDGIVQYRNANEYEQPYTNINNKPFRLMEVARKFYIVRTEEQTGFAKFF